MKTLFFHFSFLFLFLTQLPAQNDTSAIKSGRADSIAEARSKLNQSEIKAIRLTTRERNAILSPDKNMIVFNTDQESLNIYSGRSWESFIPVRCGKPFTDERDGKIYKTVLIGNQCWMRENLETKSYRNGDSIPQVTETQEWSNLYSGAWCYYKNGQDFGTIYGNLYNWYAVNDPRGICPPGWYVPEESDWVQLTNFLGGKALAGNRMREAGSAHWKDVNSRATNRSNYTALPGGYRNVDGTFRKIGYEARFWSFSDLFSDMAYYYKPIGNKKNEAYVADKLEGYSVRCLAFRDAFYSPDTVKPLSSDAQKIVIPDTINQSYPAIDSLKSDHAKFNVGFGLGTNFDFLIIHPIDDLNTHMFDSTFITDIYPRPDSARILSIGAEPQIGFTISLLTAFYLNRHFELRFTPSLSFVERKIQYDIQLFTNGISTDFQTIKKIPSVYINFPMELKIKFNISRNVQAYLLAGLQYSIDAASNAKKREVKSSKEEIVKFNLSNLFLNTGLGMNFNIKFFKFGFELKNMYGFFNNLKKEDNIYSAGIQSINSNIVQFLFTFE